MLHSLHHTISFEHWRMVPCATGSLAGQSHRIFRIMSLSRARSSCLSHQAEIPACAVRINGFSMSLSREVSSFAPNSGALVVTIDKGWDRKESGLGRPGMENSRLLAVSDGDSGGGGYADFGDGKFGGGGEGGDAGCGSSGNNWNFLSWYLYLSMLVTVAGASNAFIRVILDQVTLERRPSEAVPKLQQIMSNFGVVFCCACKLQAWIPFQLLNFRFVPQQFQVLAANVITLVWNVILSFKAHKEIIPK